MTSVRMLPLVVPFALVTRVRTFTVLLAVNGPRVLPLGSAGTWWVKSVSMPVTIHSMVLVALLS
jgi:type IV secretory pathway protease TraF